MSGAASGLSALAPHVLNFIKDRVLVSQPRNGAINYSCKAIAAFICPEDNWHRMPNMNGLG